jgi:HlyD family secretion protein
VVALLAAAGAGWYFWGGPEVSATGLEASGTVEGTEARLGFQAAGRIASIAVEEGDRVERGAELSRLDREETEARRAEAAAQLAAARAGLDELERGSRREEVAEAAAVLEAARKRRQDAGGDLGRAETLLAGGAISREARDKAAIALQVADANVAQAEERLRLVEAGPRKERIEAQRAQVARAEAALRALDAALGDRVIAAPFDGLVTQRHRQPGEVVAAGSPVLTLLDPDDRWVRIYVPEPRIGAVELGSRAAIRSDTYPDKRYAGEVYFVSSEAEFTPKSVQTQEERVRLVYAVKVRVVDDPAFELKPGMPVDVELALAPPR